VADLTEGAARLPVVPAARTGASLSVPESLLPDALSLLVGAASRVDAAGCVLPLLAGLAGVRGTAVVVRARRAAVVLASAGYDCGTMAPGATLPLDAGLPVTEAVRRGRPVVQGNGPSWVALPFGRGRAEPGALLLSLTTAPPEDPADLARLTRLARALGDAVARCSAAEDDRASLAALVDGLRPPEVVAPQGWQVAARCLPVDGRAGGDVVTALADGRGGTWLLAADVMGSGLPAALPAAAVRAAVGVAARTAAGPAAMLDAVGGAVTAAVPPGGFVTLLAVHVDADRRLRAASAGHPGPLVLLPGAAPRPLPVEPAPPLGVGSGEAAEASTELPAGAALLLHTDGLVERRGPSGVRLLDPAALAVGLPHDLDAAADAVLAAADAAADSGDDVSVLLARPRP
jgi:hypothetical protein